MNFQNQAILSLGSNLGNRLENIQLAVSTVHSTIGTVVKVSKIYETPAWGFESTPFYNAVIVVNSHLSASKILSRISKLEKQFGRKKSTKSGYEARIIDIDILSFNDEIIETENLIIPHKEIANRQFVLVPLLDVAPDWKHPILRQTVLELIQNSIDKSVCVEVFQLENPLKKIDFNKFNYIAIEGNIGAGKTTLVQKISEDFNAKTVLERFADNPFLPKFYKDQVRYAFPLEMSFLADRYQQLSDDLAQFDLFKDFIIADYHIIKSLIFANVTLTDDENRLYRNLFSIIYKEMPKPDLYIYLYQNPERLLQNIKKRGRSYEQEIQAEYLEKINRGYLDFMNTQLDLNILIIDVSNRDFVKNQADYLFILDEIKRKIQ